jgi:hypothetical protein
MSSNIFDPQSIAILEMIIELRKMDGHEHLHGKWIYSKALERFRINP